MITSTAAVVIPIHRIELSDFEKFSIRCSINALERFPIIVIHPEELSTKIHNLDVFTQATNINFYSFSNIFFKSIAGYNKLLKSHRFYQKFLNFEFILICQPDAIALSDQLDYWCNKQFSYIGAPWFSGFTNPIKPLQFIGAGNGGFSLRKVSDFFSFSKSIHYTPNTCSVFPNSIFNISDVLRFIKHHFIFCWSKGPLQTKVNEDIFWGMLVPAINKSFTVADPITASSFAFDAEPRYLYKINGDKLPFGCHAWNRYDTKFWEEHFKNHLEFLK